MTPGRILLLLAMAGCMSEPAHPDARPVPQDAPQPPPILPEPSTCACTTVGPPESDTMALPFSRDSTAVAGAQIPSALLNNLQDKMIANIGDLITAMGGSSSDDLAGLFLGGRFTMGKMWVREQFNWGPTDKSLAASQANVSLLTDKVHVTSGTQTSVLVLAPGAAAAPSPHPAVRLRHLDASTNSSLLLHQANTGSTIATSYRTIDDLDTVQFTMDWRAYLTAVGGNQLNIYMGLHETPTDASPDDATAHSFAMFRKLHGDTNWQGRFANDTSGVTDDTGVTPVANTWQDFRLDFFGAATSVGVAAGNVSVAKLYIGGALVAEDQTVCPTGAVGLGFMFRIDSTATGPAADHDLVLGPVRMQWNSSAL
jgi:hypothetical protein